MSQETAKLELPIVIGGLPPFRTLVTGWRFWPRTAAQVVRDHLIRVQETLVKPGQTMVVIDGACPYDGVDLYANEWAKIKESRGALVVSERYPAKWGIYGGAAGRLRNAYMVSLGADIVLAFPQFEYIGDGGAGGTHNCIRAALGAGLTVKQIPWTTVDQSRLPADVSQMGVDAA